MVVDEARLENGWLLLKTQPAEALKWLKDFAAGKDYEIKLCRKKRSLDANAYCWVLLDKLSAALRIPKEELYRWQITKIGGVSDTVCVPDKAVKRLKAIWESKGLGWQVETFPSKIEGCTNCILYYGSSVFDTAQMNRLITSICEDSRSIGLEVKPQEEIDSLLNQWEGKNV